MRVVALDSAGSSPKTRGNSATIGRITARTLSQPTGYGATHNRGLGLGLPELRRTTDDALSSPKRITTVPNSRASHSPAGTVGRETFSQPSTAFTPRFRPETITTPPSSAQYSDPSLLGASSSIRSGHHRRDSVASARLILVPPKSPAASMFGTIRRSASRIGMHFGGPLEYDAAGSSAGQRRLEDEDHEQGMGTNGTRVWYRYVSCPTYVYTSLTQSSMQLLCDD